MANILTIGADNIVTIDKLMVPSSNPPDYINAGTLTWSLLDSSGNTIPSGTGNYSYISGSNGEWQTIIPQSLTNTLQLNAKYTLKTNVTATGFVSLFQDSYTALAPQSLQYSYAVRSDLENVYGPTNIKNWADIENNGDSGFIDARINWALVLTYDYMNNRLQGGIYKTPLQGNYPMIVTVQAQLAAVQLYESRGITNFDESGQPIHQLKQGKDWALNVIAQLRGGVMRIQKALPQDVLGTIYPKAIISENRRCRPYFGYGYNAYYF